MATIGLIAALITIVTLMNVDEKKFMEEKKEEGWEG